MITECIRCFGINLIKLKEPTQPSIFGNYVQSYRLQNLCTKLALCTIQHSEARPHQGKHLGLRENIKAACLQAWICSSVPSTVISGKNTESAILNNNMESALGVVYAM